MFEQKFEQDWTTWFYKAKKANATNYAPENTI